MGPPQPPEYVEIEAELIEETDSAFKFGYRNVEAWVARSLCTDVEFFDNGPGRNQTIRCLMQEWVADQEELI